jgi:hypothetical protein
VWKENDGKELEASGGDVRGKKLIFVLVFYWKMNSIVKSYLHNKEMFAKLENACLDGNLDLVKSLCEKGVDIHSFDDLPFRLACGNGHLEISKFLLEKGAYIHACDDHGFRIACENGHIQIAKFLYERGADISVLEDYPLRCACQNGHIELVKFLIEKGANDRMAFDIAFDTACSRGHLEVVKLLVSRGASVKRNIISIILLFGSHEHFEIIKFFIENGADESLVSEEAKKYLSFCKKMKTKKLICAANKIGSWWIPICYNLNRECGKRMMERSWKRVEEMYLERN